MAIDENNNANGNSGSGEYIDKCNDVLALLGHANRQLNMTRRDFLKPEMMAEYVPLCSHSVPYTNNLFGDDVSKVAKDIEDCSKVGNKLKFGSGRGRGGGFFRGGRGGHRGTFSRGGYRGGRGGFRGGRGRGSGPIPKKLPERRKSTEVLDTSNEVSHCFKAGVLKKFSDEWEKITSDKFILDIVSHCHIEFIDNVEPKQDIFNVKSVFNSKESDIVSNEIQKLLAIDVIKEVQSMKDQFLSPIFLRPKKNGEYRMILNLKKLNEYIEYHHFKMDTFESAIKLVTSKSFMASIDLRHAYYSVPIAEEHQKFLRFYWNGKLFQYTCLPNGISSAPRIFTKLLKPVYSSLRVLGHVNVGYIDDSLLLGETIEECNKNVNDTIELMSKLGFVIHEDKSVFQPSKQIIFLGNIIDSENMIITLTGRQKTKPSKRM
ncbi:Hypothetical predicted protein [Mytilus galloprovincialis]|uniref:Reverse transcriptase domain-containing protein n=1 Tax=Mytilus galloprovincialis TaxID=29158 RepID=A0A8B6E6C5_MYTGA|nr:Hypothetical predicted protein [Mytilus galloprovincialis]